MAILGMMIVFFSLFLGVVLMRFLAFFSLSTSNLSATDEIRRRNGEKKKKE